ncbi:MAG: FprA family A-type flavoprotein [Coriobacteriaceae bacterium]|nr:FprA family A-type flavoprotein [Coriobacteriaceae bacterium]
MGSKITITDDIRYIGVNDHDLDLFEGQYIVPNGMAYNSYVILDEKVAVMDTVDVHFGEEWMGNLLEALDGRTPDYLVVQHMEPDHSANIVRFMDAFPAATIVASTQAFAMLKQFYGHDYADRKLVVKDKETLDLGGRQLVFVSAPMVHWPEVMMTYDPKTKTLFSADGFGKFGALDVDEDWACEARRYYFGIVGKFGKQVQALLKKAATLEIERICALHGPILSENLGYYLDLYNTWSSYGVESEGIAICYTSVYGHTKEAVELLAAKLEEAGCPKVAVTDLARDDMAEAIEDAFRYGTLVLASTTYNMGVFPFMSDFIERLVDHGYTKRRIALIENGTWAPAAAKTMRAKFEKAKDIEFCENVVTIKSALDDTSRAKLDALVAELMA